VSPTILESGPDRFFFFFSSDRAAPPHVHLAREQNLATFWLVPVRLATSLGFGAREAHRLAGLVVQHEAGCLKAWHEYFGIGGGNGRGKTGSRH